MTATAMSRSPMNLSIGLRQAISAYTMARLQALRHYLSTDRAKKELRALDGRGLADIGIAPFERDELSIHGASLETRDYVMLTAGGLCK